MVTADRDYYEHIQAVNDSDNESINFPDDLPERRIPLLGHRAPHRPPQQDAGASSRKST